MQNSHSPPSHVRAAGAGVLAASGGLAVGELLAAPFRTWLSPIIAIADRVVDAVPQPVKQFAIDTFGTNDKIALIAGILSILVLAAAGIGITALYRRTTALVLTAGFGLAGVVASLLDPVLGLVAAVPSVIAGVVAVAALAWLVSPSGETADSDHGRRVALRDLGLVAVGAAVVGGGGRLLSRSLAADVAASRQEVTLPEPVESVDFPQDAGLDVEGVVPYETPNEDFYRIDTQISVPQLSRDGWTLTVLGQVGEERSWTIDELESEFEVIERGITMTCVSNEIGGDLVGNARWRGIRVADVLDAVGVEDSADQLVGRAFDGFTTGYPVERAFDRDAMLAFGMNDEPLPAEHGFPLRMVVPGLYGYVSATKWLQELELTTFDAFDQYWVERDWDARAPIKTMSRIDTPRGLETVESGTVPIAGVAWAQTRGIERVEVRIDDGDWQDAELTPAFNDVTWVQWRFDWDTDGLDSGRHDLTVRATDSTGETQTEERQPPFPNGASGWHTVIVTKAE